ncbi:MAG: secretin N-terminal domain-containing protein [Akkermansiaceae bacterium]
MKFTFSTFSTSTYTAALVALLGLSAAQAQNTPGPKIPKPGAKPIVPAAPATPASPAVKPPVPGNANQPNAAQIANNPFLKRPPNAIAVKAGDVLGGRNMDAQDIADDYNRFTGKRVLVSTATANLELSFIQRGPMTNAEAAVLLEKQLNMEGYALVPSGPNEVKLLPKAQGANENPSIVVENLIHDPADLPEGDAYVSYIMKLNFIKPEEALRIFTQSIHQLGPGAKLAPVPNASAIIITGKASFIRKLINQKYYIDVATGNLDTQWIPLKFADAEEVATQLNEIMNAQRQRKTTAGVTTGQSRASSSNRPPVPTARSGGNAAASSGSSAAGEDIPITIVGNVRLNKILLMGRPVDILFVEGLVREFDAPPNKNNYVKRKLRFLIASDFLDIAEDALTANNASGTTQQGQGGGRSRTQQRQPQNRGGNTGGGQNGNRATAESVQEFNVSDVPESRVVGKTFIVADNLNNSVLVQGPPESIRVVSELLDKLDGRPQQVMISTIFGEITLGKDRDVGVSLGRISDGANGGRSDGAGNIDTGIGALQDIQALGTLAGLNTASAAGMNLYGTVGNVTGMIRALETQSNFTVLSRPTVYTANNRKAVISSGRRIAVPTNTFQNGGTNGASQSTNIEYRDVLLRFEVVPLINSETEVTLKISLLNEDTQGSQVIDGNTIPTIVTESINTTVSVPNETTVVLGGLVSESTTVTKTGVPLLSNVPLLGRLFTRNEKGTTRRELLIFIQPKIVNGAESLDDAQRDMDKHYDVAPRTRDFANGIVPRKGAIKPATKKSTPAPKKTIPKASSRPTSLRYPTRR